MKSLSLFDWIAVIFAVVGGLNWGLVGLFNFNLVSTIFGTGTFFSKLVYIVVAVSAIFVLFIANRFNKFSQDNFQSSES